MTPQTKDLHGFFIGPIPLKFLLHHNQLSLRRVAIAFAVLAFPLGYYRSLSFAGMPIGLLVGVPLLCMVLVIQPTQFLDILRCSVYAAIGATLAAFVSPFDISPALYGGVIGWAIAVTQNLFIRIRGYDKLGVDPHIDTSEYGR